MISLAVAAAGWVGVSSPGDYVTFKFPPLPRHDLAVPALMVLYLPMLYGHVNHCPRSTFRLSLWFIAAHVLGICLVLIALRELLGLYSAQARQSGPKAREALASIDGEPVAAAPGVPLIERLKAMARGCR